MKINRNHVVAVVATRTRQAVETHVEMNPDHFSAAHDIERDFVIRKMQEVMQPEASPDIQKWIDGIKAPTTWAAFENDITREVESQCGVKRGHWGRRRSQIKVQAKPLAELSRPLVHDMMLHADGLRARIAYQGLDELENKLHAQGIKDHHKRFGQRTDKLVAKNRATDEYKAADDLFRSCSDRLREIDGDSQVRDRDGKVANLFNL